MVIKLDHRHKKLDGDLLLTTACPVECDFCVYSCEAEKDPDKWMPEGTIRRVAEEYSKNDIGIRIGGGEPFYDLERLENCIKILLEHFKPNEILIITSGFFGTDKMNALKHLGVIKKYSFDTLVISSDRFHLKRVPLKNIENIIETCKELEIEPVLRISIDSESYSLIDKLVEIIAREKIAIEVHSWGSFGRGERLDKTPLGDFTKDQEYFFSRLKEAAEKFNSPKDPKYYLTHSAKRSQKRYASDFFPTTFPNGSVYGCSMTTKGSYMGNINKESLVEMIFRWKTATLQGNFNLSEWSCQEMSRFLPKKYKQRCEYCKSYPIEFPSKEALGQKYVRVTSDADLEKILEELKKEQRELLISFRLTANDLTKENGERIRNFLEKLEESGVRYYLSRPLPRCLGFQTRPNDPKNCFECRELFTIEEGVLKYCEPSGIGRGYSIDDLKDREQIYEYFETKNKGKKPPSFCEKCIFMLRKQCDGLCFKE